MKRTILLLLLFTLLLSGCAETPLELLDEETALTLALEEAKEYVPLGLAEDSAVCEYDDAEGLYRITFEPDELSSGSKGTRLVILIDPLTGETVDVLLGN